MRQLSIVVALSVGCGCANLAAEKAPPPPYQRVEGAIMVGITSAAADPRPQADAFAAFVQDATGQVARAAVFPDYDSLAVALAEGKLDVAFMSPLAYVRATSHGKVQALVRATRHGLDTYRAVLFARMERQLRSIDSLRPVDELRAAWVDASSATGHIFPKALLLQHHINPAVVFVSQEFFGSHDAVCRAVYERKADVGATFVDDASSGEVAGCRPALGDGVSELSIIAISGEIPNDVLAVRAGFPEDVKGRLLVGATSLATSEEGKKVLAAAFHAEGFSKLKRDDYDVVRDALEVFRP